MTHQCEALRRKDHARCPNPGKYALPALRRWLPNRDGSPREERTIHLCGQHKSALGKGIMAVPLVAEPGQAAYISQSRQDTYSWDEYEVIEDERT